jgi:predicted TIM-barrel fold metal-dependent hydrolase
MTYDGPLLDAHHHFWDLSMERHPWLAPANRRDRGIGDVALLHRNYLPEDLKADAARQHLVGSVHVEAGWDPADPVGETRWLDRLAERSGLPTVLVVNAPLHKPEAAAVLEQQAAFPRVRGVRFILSWHDDPEKRFADRPDHMEDAAWRAGFARLRQHGMSFDMMLYPQQMEAAARLAAAFPDTQIILNHCGSPIDRDPAGMARWRAGLKLLAARPNVAIKISDLVAYDHHWTLDSLRPVVLACLEAFGTDRAMFGSDAPVAGLHASYDEVFDSFKTIVADLAPGEQRRLFHDNAVRLYRAPVTPAASA